LKSTAGSGAGVLVEPEPAMSRLSLRRFVVIRWANARKARMAHR
jgi:hypothetical protein